MTAGFMNRHELVVEEGSSEKRLGLRARKRTFFCRTKTLLLLLLPAAATAAAGAFGLRLLVMSVPGGLNVLRVGRFGQRLLLGYPVAVVRVVAVAASFFCCCASYCCSCCCCAPAAVQLRQLPLLYGNLTLTAVGNADYKTPPEWTGLFFRACTLSSVALPIVSSGNPSDAFHVGSGYLHVCFFS